MRLHHSLALIIATVLIMLSQQTLAHEGHDPEIPAKAVVIPASPRGEASSDTFELVAIARSGEIIIYLDRFATNEPVSDASLVVETPRGSVEAKAASDGIYRLAAPWAANPGRYDLIATVTKDSD